MNVPLRRLPHGAGLPLPAYASGRAAGLDLLAAVAEPLTLARKARPGAHRHRHRPSRGASRRRSGRAPDSPRGTASPC